MSDSLSILLVDDHEDTNRSLMLLLRRRGYQVETAVDIASALELADGETFDVLVSDMNLPDGSGVDLLERMASHPPTLRWHHRQRLRPWTKTSRAAGPPVTRRI